MMRYVEFPGPLGKLRGMMHIPAGKGPFPGVVLCHGLTGNRMECGFLWVALSRKLEAAGIASLRFDCYGSGESDGDFVEMTPSTERADLVTALDFFKAQHEVDPERVGLCGMSMGGFVTALVLGMRPDVRAGVTYAAVGDMNELWSRRLDEDGAQRKMIEERGWVSWAGLRISREFVADLAKHDAWGDIAGYKGPVLVVHGTDDQTVPLDHAKEYVRVLEGRAGKPPTDHLYVEGEGHTFNSWDKRQVVFERTVGWFKKHL